MVGRRHLQHRDFFNSLALVKLLSANPARLGTYMALVMIAKVLPTVLLGPLAGVLADRLPRRTVMIASDLLRAMLVLGLVFTENPAAMITLVFLSAAAAAFYNPASNALLPTLVPPEELVTAGSLSVVTQRLALLLGNGIGAAVLMLVQAAVGLLVPDQVRGRIFSGWAMVQSLIYVGGVFAAGALSDALGPTRVLLGFITFYLLGGIYAFAAFRSPPPGPREIAA